MLDSPLVWWFAQRIRLPLPGGMFHRAALGALAHESYPAADALFECAADRYRLDLQVEPLARLRVHQRIGRLRASGNPARDPAACLDIEQRIARLTSIESLDAPYALVPASSLLATWITAAIAEPGGEAVPGAAPIRDAA